VKGTIDPNSDRPVYKQIADQLRTAIQIGEYPPNTVLPSEAALTKTFGVARMTAHQALELLKAEGLVKAEHGRGSFVRDRSQIRRLSRTRQTREFRETGRGAFDAEMRALGMEPSVELIEVGPVPCPPEIGSHLELRKGERVLIRRRRMFADGEPMQLATSYVPWSIAKGTQIIQEDTGPGGLYSRLADAGHEPKRFTEEVNTRTATEIEARFLGFSTPQPVFHLVRTAIDAAGPGTPVEVCEQVMAGDRWQLLYEWPAD
jgi:GntR family transcriptional regulator